MYMTVDTSGKLFKIPSVKVYINDVTQGKKVGVRELFPDKLDGFYEINPNFSFRSIAEAKAFIDVIQTAISQLEKDVEPESETSECAQNECENVMPPCNIGDAVYVLEGREVTSYIVDYFNSFISKSYSVCEVHLVNINNTKSVFSTDFGKTVFTEGQFIEAVKRGDAIYREV